MVYRSFSARYLCLLSLILGLLSCSDADSNDDIPHVMDKAPTCKNSSTLVTYMPIEDCVGGDECYKEKETQCNAPPSNACLDAKKLKTYQKTGTCDAVASKCNYKEIIEDCSAGCDATNARCKSEAALIRVSNNPSCAGDLNIAPSAGQESHWVATRLTPPKYPFVVSAVEYELISGTDSSGYPCEAKTAHRLQVFASDTANPPPSPTVLSEVAVPAATNVPDGVRKVHVDLPQAVTITQGQHLYVAIQNFGTDPVVSCFRMCDQTVKSTIDFWSNANSAPFSWVTLASFNVIYGRLNISALGTTP